MTNAIFAQSATEHHIWQEEKTFRPLSTTAVAITGPIKLSGNPKFAVKGSMMSITFGRGKPIALRSEGASWRLWADASLDKKTAEVFRLARDPGKLENGNTLCGDPKGEPARYVVFLEDSLPYTNTPLLGVLVFSSKKPPRDINSPGLCGTFNYEID
jgi:hypothetical protein